MCVLAMYDVRGIQAYIFRTNKVKDIIGASTLVDNIIQKAFSKASEKVFGEAKEQVVIEEIKEDNIIYWRDENEVHHVPKRSLEEVLIKQE